MHMNLFAGAIGSKIPFISKDIADFANKFSRYLHLCYVNPAYHKLETFPLL